MLLPKLFHKFLPVHAWPLDLDLALLVLDAAGAGHGFGHFLHGFHGFPVVFLVVLVAVLVLLLLLVLMVLLVLHACGSLVPVGLLPLLHIIPPHLRLNLPSIPLQHPHPLPTHLDLPLGLAHHAINQLRLLHYHIPHADTSLVESMIDVILGYLELVDFVGEVEIGLVDVGQELVGLL